MMSSFPVGENFTRLSGQQLPKTFPCWRELLRTSLFLVNVGVTFASISWLRQTFGLITLGFLLCGCSPAPQKSFRTPSGFKVFFYDEAAITSLVRTLGREPIGRIFVRRDAKGKRLVLFFPDDPRGGGFVFGTNGEVEEALKKTHMGFVESNLPVSLCPNPGQLRWETPALFVCEESNPLPDLREMTNVVSVGGRFYLDIDGFLCGTFVRGIKGWAYLLAPDNLLVGFPLLVYANSDRLEVGRPELIGQLGEAHRRAEMNISLSRWEEVSRACLCSTPRRLLIVYPWAPFGAKVFSPDDPVLTVVLVGKSSLHLAGSVKRLVINVRFQKLKVPFVRRVVDCDPAGEFVLLEGGPTGWVVASLWDGRAWALRGPSQGVGMFLKEDILAKALERISRRRSTVP